MLEPLQPKRREPAEHGWHALQTLSLNGDGEVSSNVPAPHGGRICLHLRSEVAVGGDASNCEEEHCVSLVHSLSELVLGDLDSNSEFEHLACFAHPPVPATDLNVPLGQDLQTPAEASPHPERKNPGLHDPQDWHLSV